MSKYEFCWGCPYSTMDNDNKRMIFFRCDLSHMRIACEAATPSELQFKRVPEWCPIKKKEEKDKIVHIIY